MQKNTNLQGFTLIELSVVLIISGLLLVGAISAYEIYDEKQKIERMNNLMANVDQAIQDFAQTEGRLPCPAAVNGSAAGNDYDLEQCSTANGVVRDGGVLIGKLPASTLAIRNEYMKDIHSNYLVYAVTEAATVDGSAAGAVVIIEEGIDEDQTSPTYGTLIELDRHNNALYAITSLGQTGVGAYAHDSTQSVVCNGAQKEIENCNDDRTFIFSLLSERSDVNEFYDDRVAFRNTIGGFANIPDVLLSAKLGEDFQHSGGRLENSDYEILEDDMYAEWSWSCDMNSDLGCRGAGNSHFLELEKGDQISTATQYRSGDIVIEDRDGNVVGLDSRQVDDEFIFATNPSGGGDNGFEYHRYQGGDEMQGGYYGKKFRLFRKK